MSVTRLDSFEEMDDRTTPFGRYDGDDDDEEEEDGIPKIRIGICAMSKKVSHSGLILLNF